MGLELRLQQKLAPQLVMTPQLQQAIKLLQLSHLEMGDLLRQQLEENPLLEEDEAPSLTPSTLEEPGYISLSELPLGSQSTTDDGLTHDGGMPHAPTLLEHLTWQLIMGPWPEVDRRLAIELAAFVDEDGLLRREAIEAARAILGRSAEELADAQRILQQLEPLGVAAEDLESCLLHQARHRAPGDTLMVRLIEHHLLDLPRLSPTHLGKALGTEPQLVVEALRRIAALEPRPGRHFAAAEPQFVVPDLFVHPSERAEDGFALVVNVQGLPRLRLSDAFGGRAAKDALTSGYIQEKRRAASWLLRSMAMRQRTLCRVMRSLLKHQRAFFEHGVEHLRPLTLKAVAEDVEMHESTISRVTTNKFVHTPLGLFELKYFFNSSIRATAGEDVASASVRQHIERLIGEESAQAPLSDQALVALLAQRDIAIARRTVAKYREMLKIPPSSQRRRMF